MNLLGSFESFLYIISTALFYPVVIGLVILVFWVIVQAGGFLRELLDRRRRERSPLVEKFRQELEVESATAGQNTRERMDILFERKLQQTELTMVKSLDWIRSIVRIGPSFGLMGTLIPMGVALASLAQGDMPAMASSMVTAFTTTIVGLACGVAAYMISLTREKWVREDISELEYLCESAMRDSMLGKHGFRARFPEEVHAAESEN